MIGNPLYRVHLRVVSLTAQHTRTLALDVAFLSKIQYIILRPFSNQYFFFSFLLCHEYDVYIVIQLLMSLLGPSVT
jgi:hypothetical protein